jgi:MoaA/NifB/PqqE/SkfB family radical SAM enzyme
MNGLTNINIELTNKCNKSCWMCGRRKIEKSALNFKDLYNNEIDFELLKKISNQVPKDITIQLHNNGEPLMYSKFGEAASLFKNNIRNIVTNGKLLLEKFDEIVNDIETLSISIFERDVESDNQYEIIKKFLELKGKHKPFVTLRLIGEVDKKRYEELNTLIITRALHSPDGSFKYEKKQPTIPEVGICWDFLSHLAINTMGDVSCCVRFDPDGLGILGNIKNNTIEELWNGERRQEWKNLHIMGMRNKISLCSKCEFWGVPTGI